MMEDKLDTAKVLKEELYRQLARIGKSLSSDKRLEILNVLAQSPKTVEKLAQFTGMNIANVSRHLQILLDAKLVKFTKKGTYAIYSVADPEVIDFMSSLWRISEKQLPDISKLKDDFINNLDGIQTLNMDEVMEKANNESIILVDLRSKEEFETGHIPGAISMPMNKLDTMMLELPKNAEVIAYCQGPVCAYSALAVEKLQQEGFKAYRLDAGINEWQSHFMN